MTGLYACRAGKVKLLPSRTPAARSASDLEALLRKQTPVSDVSRYLITERTTLSSGWRAASSGKARKHGLSFTAYFMGGAGNTCEWNATANVPSMGPWAAVHSILPLIVGSYPTKSSSAPPLESTAGGLESFGPFNSARTLLWIRRDRPGETTAKLKAYMQ